MDWDDSVVIAPKGFCSNHCGARKSLPTLAWASTTVWVPTACCSREMTSKGNHGNLCDTTVEVFDRLKGEVDVVLSFTCRLWSTNLYGSGYSRQSVFCGVQRSCVGMVEFRFFQALLFGKYNQHSGSLMTRARSAPKPAHQHAETFSVTSTSSTTTATTTKTTLVLCVNGIPSGTGVEASNCFELHLWLHWAAALALTYNIFDAQLSSYIVVIPKFGFGDVVKDGPSTRYNGQSCNASCVAPFEPITYEYVCVLARDVVHLDDDLVILRPWFHVKMTCMKMRSGGYPLKKFPVKED